MGHSKDPVMNQSVIMGMPCFHSLISGGNSPRSDSNPCALHGCDAFSFKDQGGGLSLPRCDKTEYG